MATGERVGLPLPQNHRTSSPCWSTGLAGSLGEGAPTLHVEQRRGGVEGPQRLRVPGAVAGLAQG